VKPKSSGRRNVGASSAGDRFMGAEESRPDAAPTFPTPPIGSGSRWRRDPQNWRFLCLECLFRGQKQPSNEPFSMHVLDINCFLRPDLNVHRFLFSPP
jgi:hypothetical protein